MQWSKARAVSHDTVHLPVKRPTSQISGHGQVDHRHCRQVQKYMTYWGLVNVQSVMQLCRELKLWKGKAPTIEITGYPGWMCHVQRQHNAACLQTWPRSILWKGSQEATESTSSAIKGPEVQISPEKTNLPLKVHCKNLWKAQHQLQQCKRLECNCPIWPFFCCERLSASMARSLHLRFSLCTTSDSHPGPEGSRTAAICQP